MCTEEPALLPSNSLYQAVKACIQVADPDAEALLNNPHFVAHPEYFRPLPKGSQVMLPKRRARFARREFLRVLGEVELWRRGALKSSRQQSQLKDREVSAAVKGKTTDAIKNGPEGGESRSEFDSIIMGARKLL